MRKCFACERWFDHRHESACPWCGAVPLTLQKLQAENARLRAQVTQLQEHNTAEVERRRKAEAAMADAIREMTAYARICGELEAQLCGQLVEHPGRKAMLLVLAELRRAKLKYPRFATGPEQGFAVLARESGELADAVVKGDLDGEHGIIREAAQVAAVAIRIIEMALGVPNGRRCGDCGQPNGFEGCEGCRFASDHPLWIPKTADKRTEAPRMTRPIIVDLFALQAQVAAKDAELAKLRRVAEAVVAHRKAPLYHREGGLAVAVGVALKEAGYE